MHKKNLLITLTGRDKVGLVDHVTKIVLECNGNVEASRMAHLGGEFAMLMLVDVSEEKHDHLRGKLDRLKGEGYEVSICETEQSDPSKYSGWIPYKIEVYGADHEGIIHSISHHLAKYGISIETMDTNMAKAPMSGTPLFTMSAVIMAPPDQPHHKWSEEMENACDNLNVDIKVSPYKG